LLQEAVAVITVLFNFGCRAGRPGRESRRGGW